MRTTRDSFRTITYFPCDSKTLLKLTIQIKACLTNCNGKLYIDIIKLSLVHNNKIIPIITWSKTFYDIKNRLLTSEEFKQALKTIYSTKSWQYVTNFTIKDNMPQPTI